MQDISEISAEHLEMIDAIVNGKTPLERWNRTVGVNTFSDLKSWASNQLREILIIRKYRNLHPNQSDNLDDYLVGKQTILNSLIANIRQIEEQTILNSLMANIRQIEEYNNESALD